MHFVIIGSAGGSAFAAMHDIREAVSPGRHTYSVITDRECGLESVSRERHIPVVRLEKLGNEEFSVACANTIGALGPVDGVLLYFSRLVTRHLYGARPICNIHPSLLPAYPGLGAVEAAYAGHACFLGSSVIAVDGSVDQGPLIAQTCMPVGRAEGLERWKRYAFLQKVYLSLLWSWLLESGRLAFREHGGGFLPSLGEGLTNTDRCNPALGDEALLAEFRAFQEKWNGRVV